MTFGNIKTKKDSVTVVFRRIWFYSENLFYYTLICYPPILVTFSESTPILLNLLWLHPFYSILDWSPNFAQVWSICPHVSRIAFITPKFLGFKVSTLVNLNQFSSLIFDSRYYFAQFQLVLLNCSIFSGHTY